MPKQKEEQESIEQYTYPEKKRKNNPPVGLVTPDTDQDAPKKQYQFDPHLDPQLQWAGKAEHTSFEVDTVSLHVHERIDPLTIINHVTKKDEPADSFQQLSLFEKPENYRPLREAIDFYKHDQDWSNRLIAGDSLLVMNSLLEKEGMAGKVQMIYIDPPYGVKYGSNSPAWNPCPAPAGCMRTGKQMKTMPNGQWSPLDPSMPRSSSARWPWPLKKHKT